MSIRVRLTLWYTVLLSLVLAVFALLVYAVVARQLASQLEYAIHLQALDASRTAHALPVASPAVHSSGRWTLPLTGRSLKRTCTSNW